MADSSTTRSGKRYGRTSRPSTPDQEEEIGAEAIAEPEVVDPSETKMIREAAGAMERLTNDLRKCTEDRDAAKQQIEKLSEQVEQRDISLESLTTDMQKLKLGEEDARRKLQAANDKAEEQEFELQTLQAQLGEMKTNLDAALNETKRYLDNSTDDTTEVAGLKEQIVQLNDEIKQLHQDRGNNLQTLQRTKQDLNDQVSANKNLSERITQLLTDFEDQSVTAATEKQNQIDELQTRIIDLHRQNMEIKESVERELGDKMRAELERVTASYEAQIKIHATKAAELQTSKLKELEKIHNLQIEIRELRNQIGDVFFYLSRNQYKEFHATITTLFARIPEEDNEATPLITSVIRSLSEGLVIQRQSQGKGVDWTLHDTPKSVTYEIFEAAQNIAHATPRGSGHKSPVNVTFTTPKSRVSFAEKIQKTKIITPEATTVKEEEEKLESKSHTATQSEERKQLDTIEELPGETATEETINTIGQGNKVEKYLCKQPEIFKINKGTSFKNFWVVFKNYAKASNLPKDRWLKTLMTFLDTEALMRLETMGLNVDTELTDDDQIQETIDKITNALTNQRDIATAKTRLLRYSQQEEQSITEFATKLRELSNEAYGDHEKDAMRLEVLMDVFINGLWDENIQLQVQLKRPKSFQDALNIALELERSVIQRMGKGRKDDAENVFNIERPDQPSHASQPSPQTPSTAYKWNNRDPHSMKICYRCRKPGHIRINCTTRIQCGRCGRLNHVTDQCRLLVQNSDVRNVPSYSNRPNGSQGYRPNATRGSYQPTGERPGPSNTYRRPPQNNNWNQRPNGYRNNGANMNQRQSQEEAAKLYLQAKRKAINNMVNAMEEEPKNF